MSRGARGLAGQAEAGVEAMRDVDVYLPSQESLSG